MAHAKPHIVPNKPQLTLREKVRALVREYRLTAEAHEKFYNVIQVMLNPETSEADKEQQLAKINLDQTYLTFYFQSQFKKVRTLSKDLLHALSIKVLKESRDLRDKERDHRDSLRQSDRELETVFESHFKIGRFGVFGDIRFEPLNKGQTKILEALLAISLDDSAQSQSDGLGVLCQISIESSKAYQKAQLRPPRKAGRFAPAPLHQAGREVVKSVLDALANDPHKTFDFNSLKKNNKARASFSALLLPAVKETLRVLQKINAGDENPAIVQELKKQTDFLNRAARRRRRMRDVIDFIASTFALVEFAAWMVLLISVISVLVTLFIIPPLFPLALALTLPSALTVLGSAIGLLISRVASDIYSRGQRSRILMAIASEPMKALEGFALSAAIEVQHIAEQKKVPVPLKAEEPAPKKAPLPKPKQKLDEQQPAAAQQPEADKPQQQPAEAKAKQPAEQVAKPKLAAEQQGEQPAAQPAKQQKQAQPAQPKPEVAAAAGGGGVTGFLNGVVSFFGGGVDSNGRTQEQQAGAAGTQQRQPQPQRQQPVVGYRGTSS